MKWARAWSALLVALMIVSTGSITMIRYINQTDPCFPDRRAEEHSTSPVEMMSGAGSAAGEGAHGLRLSDLEPLHVSESWRVGIGVPGGAEESVWVTRLGAGWWFSWGVLPSESLPPEAEFWQMVRLHRGETVPSIRDIKHLAGATPGQVWVIGNEPDVIWQDNVTPACYARLYHDLYVAIKRADPTARVAFGGVAQGSPLRLAYLDAILRSYQERYGQPLPADIWTLHGFVLREQRGWWGVDIPPGIANEWGLLYGLSDHDDAAAFAGQISAFRRWMTDRGYRDRPLAVTEYGVLMPSQYGFSAERVIRFMYAAFDFFLCAGDPETGYPEDNNRLVQRWAWFSLADPVFPTGNLINPESGTLTAVGEAYREYIEHIAACRELEGRRRAWGVGGD